MKSFGFNLKMTLLRSFVLLGTGFLLFTNLHSADIYMNLEKKQAPGMYVGIIILQDKPDAGSIEVLKVIKGDFAFSALFNFDETPFNSDSAKNNFETYYNEKAFDSILTFTANATGGIFASLFSRDDPGPLFKKEYKGENLRKNAHRLASDVMKTLTGETPPVSTRIVFVQKQKGAKEICVADYDGKNFDRLTALKSLSLSPRWFPGGRKIAFTSYYDGNPDIYELDTAFGKTTPLSTVHGLNASPAVSPTGKQLLLTLSRDGNSEIYLKDLTSKSLKRLTMNSVIDTAPCFAPNGTTLAFVSDRSGTPNIYTMDTDGANVKRITYKNPYNDSPVFSPDGKKIAYAVRGGAGIDIWLYNYQTEEETSLTEGDGYNESPSWSADGGWLVLAHRNTLYAKQNLMLISLDGSRKITLNPAEGDLSEPDWEK